MSSSPLEYLSLTALLTYSAGVPAPRPPPIPWLWYWWHYPQPPPPSPGPDPPVYATFLGNIYYATIAGLIVTTAVTHPTEVNSLRYGPFLLLPAVLVGMGLVGNNLRVTGPDGGTKGKEGKSK